MALTKRKNQPAGDEPVAVTVEPRDGHTDADVTKRLTEQGATNVEVLAPGYISARLAPAQFAAVEAVAVVHVKATKRPT